jgi:hypothetical protein
VLALAASPFSVQGQIQWFVPNGTSDLSVSARASAGADQPPAACTFLTVHPPTNCPLCSQRAAMCKPVAAPTTTFRASEQVRAVAPSKNITMTATANQASTFSDSSVSSRSSVATNFIRDGGINPGNRGNAQSAGDVYFQILGSHDRRYELRGRMLWHERGGITGRAALMLNGIPNTGSGGDPISFQSHLLPGNAATLAKSGRLQPGVYRLRWWVDSDATLTGGSATLDFDLTFDALRRFNLTVDDLTGSATVVFANGRRQKITSPGQLTLDELSTISTGPNAALALTMPDGVNIVIDEDTTFQLDRYVYEPPTPSTQVWRVIQGLFIWTSGKLTQFENANKRIDAPSIGVTIRGTKFELLVRPNQSGHVKVFEGAMDLRSKHSDSTILVSAGRMITFGSRGEISKPVPIQ